jgi:hypothetical protein
MRRIMGRLSTLGVPFHFVGGKAVRRNLMSQIGTVTSVASQHWEQVGTYDSRNWIVCYTYQLDAGGTGTAQVVVGGGRNAVIASWASPTSTITVPNPPGTTNPVVLACPPLVQAATFGLALK